MKCLLKEQHFDSCYLRHLQINIHLNQIKENAQLQRTIAFAAVLLLGVKLLAWWLTHSIAVLTDALEGIVNVVASAFGLFSLAISSKPKDDEHPYGHGKIEFISAGFEGLLISIAGVYILYTASLRLYNPSPVHKLDIGILLVIFSTLVNLIFAVKAKKLGKITKSAVLKSSAAHLFSDVYSSIGLIAGLLLVWVTGWVWLDAVVAIVFAVIILYTGYKIIKSSVSGIMDEADEELLGLLVEKLNDSRRQNWIDLHNMRIIKYGSMLHIDCHLTVPWYFDVREAHKEVDALSSFARENFGESLELFVHSDDCQPTSCSICTKLDCTVRQKDFTKTIIWTKENIRQNSKHHIHT